MGRPSGSKQTFKFAVSDLQIQIELRKFVKELGDTVEKVVIQERVTEKLVESVIHRLNARYPFAKHIVSGRMRLLRESIGKKQKTKKSITKGTRVAGIAPRKVTVEIGHVDTMTRETLISRLDKKAPLRHIHGSSGNPIKKNTSVKANKFHLWRLLEEPKRDTYPITPTTRTTLKFTSSKDNYESFVFKGAVTWKSRMGSASKAHYFLTAQRDIYYTEQSIMLNAYLKGVNKVIMEKTRFHR